MWRIALHELSQQARDGRILIAGLALLSLLTAAVASGWAQFEQAQREREHFMEQAHDQWINQGDRHPHRAAHFGTYVVKPDLSLAFFEPGLRPFAGQTLWLEAHDRPAFTNIPAEDDLTLGTGLGVVSGATVLQMLGSLFAIVLGALSIVRERETGLLRQVLSQGVHPTQWVGGKLIGLGAVLAVPLAPAILIASAGFLNVSPVEDRADIAVRTLILMISNCGLLTIALMLGLAISARARSSRTALLLAIGVWIFGFVLAPRLAATLSERIAPPPSLAAYQEAVGREFSEGFDSRGGYMTQLAQLETETRQKYGVDRLEDLPTGFSGIRMKHLDAWSTEVDDREFRKLTAIYERQTSIRHMVALLSPFVAARGVSQGMAGSDWAHYQAFLEAAESYRRRFGRDMNDLIQESLTGTAWEMDGTSEDWANIEPFVYHVPSSDWAVARQTMNLLILSLWFVMAACILILSARRLRP